MRLSRQFWCLALLAVVLPAGACSAGRSGSEAVRAVAPVMPPPPPGTAGLAAGPGASPGADPGTVRFALDQYLPAAAQANDIDTVIKRLTRDCLSRHGRPWEPVERNDIDLLRHRAQRFGLADEGLAESSGYHWDPAPAQRPLSAAQARLGCEPEAGRVIGWRADEWDWLRRLGAEALGRAWADPRATAVVERWSACMAGAGFGYERPQDAATDPRWWAPRAVRATAVEKRTAVADVRCKARVGLVEVLGGVLAEAQQRAVRENIDRLEAFRRMADSAGARADTLRGDRRPGGGAPSTPVPPGLWRTEHASA
ncbi:hypothetical protein [Actinoplanes solisilvae]|uniref:hypothetical protein n=1 Tax=Actinoplanes solisilvae TaxID=2486853 RepID=UPI000FD85608|nr:hypothetical protein [Actinoplanes solisilvae]